MVFVRTQCESTSQWCAIEHWTLLFSLIVGSVLYAVLISDISSIVLTMGMGQRMLRQKVKQVNEYMRAKRLPVTLRDKVSNPHLSCNA